MCSNQSFTEEIKVSADKLIDSIKDLLHEGNVTHIVVKNAEGHIVVEVPVSVGIVGLIVAPVLAAIGAIAVFAADFTVVVTRTGEPAVATAPPVEEPPVP